MASSGNKIISILIIAVFFFSQIPLSYAAEDFAVEESLAQDAQGAETYASLEYDANGNLIKGFGKTYEYNSENQLVKIKDNSGKTLEEYVYDYEGNRIKKTSYVEGNPVVTYYPDENFVSEVKNGVTENTIFYYLDGQIIARKDNSGVYYYHPDHLGSTTLVTDANGNVVEEEYYLPFGASPDDAGEERGFKTGVIITGPKISGGKPATGSQSRYLYTGKEKDASGLYYYGARYYDPFIAHFIQPDSVIQDVYNPQNLNRYSYVLNNPYKYIDTTGNYVDIAFDIGFIIYDIHELKNNFNVINSLALAVDVVGAALPFATGGGLIVRGITKASKIEDVAKVVSGGDKIADAGRGVKDVRGFKISELYASHPVDNPSGLFKESKFKTHTAVKEPLEIVGVQGKDIVAHGHGRTAREIVKGKDTVLGRYIYQSSDYVGKASKNVQRLEQRWLDRATHYGKFQINEIKIMYRRFIGK